MKRVLITGAAGFLGTHLRGRLAQSCRVLSVDLVGGEGSESEDWIQIERAESLSEGVVRTRPDIVVHAAFLNRKPPAWSETQYLEAVSEVNQPLFRSCAELRVPTILVSSSAVYGATCGEDPVTEKAPLNPVSLYGKAKALQEELGREAATAGLDLLVVRLFNLIGPGQRPGMLLPDWVGQVRRIAAGGEPVLRVRHLATRRDFVDVRDAAAATQLLINDFRPGETVNVASGRAVSLSEIQSFLQSLCPVGYNVLESETAPSKTDVAVQRGSSEKLRREWGWTPEIDWRQSIRDLWDSMAVDDF